MIGNITIDKTLEPKGYVYKSRYFIDGIEVSEREYDKALAGKPSKRLTAALEVVREAERLFGAQTDWKKPMLSDALAVHPKQVKEAIKDAQRKGVPVNVLADGRIEFRNRQQFNAYLKAYGYFNKDAGYGDTADGQSRARDSEKPPEVNPKDYDWSPWS